MFSPVKAVVGALVFALGGVLLITQPFGQQGSIPGAEQGTEPPDPVVVTGTFTSEDLQSYGSTVEEGGIFWTEGPWWNLTWEASDPRLIGQGTKIANWNESKSTGVGIGAETYVLDGPDGRWVGSGHFFATPTGGVDLVVLHGEGAYDGLTASLSIDWSDVATFEGVIFPGEAPMVPEPVEPPAD